MIMNAKGEVFLESIPNHASMLMRDVLLFALSISIASLLQFGAPFGGPINYPLLLMAALTFSLSVILLPLHLAMNSPTPLNPTSPRWIRNLGTATLTASFSTLALALPNAFTAFANSNIFSYWGFAWAPQLGLILFSIALLCQLIKAGPISRCRPSINVAFFNQCVALAALLTESHGLTASTVPFPYGCAIYQTYCIYQFALVPCTFVLGALLLMLDVVAPDSSVYPFVSVVYKEGFSVLTLSVGCITLLLCASHMVCAWIHSFVVIAGAVPI